MIHAPVDRTHDLSWFEELIRFIPADDRDTWLRVGMALHAESGGSTTGLGIWSAWSRTCSAKFNEVNQCRTWKNFKGSKVTGGTIVKLARENGYMIGQNHTAFNEAKPCEERGEKPKARNMPWRCTEERLNAQGYKCVATYDYGKAGEKLRFENSSNKKTFAWRYAIEGQWLTGKRPDTPCPPYGLARLLEHADQAAFVVEGEKDADRLNGEGAVAINIERGHEGIASEYLIGRVVYVIADNDEVGVRRAEEVIAAIVGKAASVCRLPLPGLGPKGDVSDWLDAGHTFGNLIELTEDAAEADDIQRLSAAFTMFEDIVLGPEEEFIIDEILPREGTGILYGPSGLGKTFLTLDLSLSIGRGIDFAGRYETAHGGVIYIALEAHDGVKKRVTGYRRERGVNSAYFALLRYPLNLGDAKSVDGLLKLLDEYRDKVGLPIRLVVIDTLSKAMPGLDENAAAAMSMVVQSMERIRESQGCFILAVHHTGKDVVRGMRGSSSLFANVDIVLRVQGDEEGADRELILEKTREAESRRTVCCFRLDKCHLGQTSRGKDITTAIVSYIEALGREPSKKPSPTQQAILDELNHLVVEGRSTKMQGHDRIPDGVDAVAVDDLRSAYFKKQGIDPPTRANKSDRSAFGVQIKRMANTPGLIATYDGKIWKINQQTR